MYKNEIRPKPKPQTQPKKKKVANPAVRKKAKSGKSFKVGKTVTSLIDGSFLAKDSFIKNLPFVFYMAILALAYIANTYLAERTMRDIEKSKLTLKELRSEYITTKSELMSGRKQTQVARKIAPTGIVESLDPPRKIVQKKTKINENKEQE